jgi:gas vesicle protein
MKFLVGLVLGAAAGAVGAFVMADRMSEDERADLTRQVQEFGSKLDRSLRDVQATVNEQRKQMQAKSQDAGAAASEAASDAAETAKDAAVDLTDSAKKAATSAKRAAGDAVSQAADTAQAATDAVTDAAGA